MTEPKSKHDAWRNGFPYHLQQADRCGVFREEFLDSLEEAAKLAALWRVEYPFPTSMVILTNLDKCDYDSDGLTEEEREMFYG